MNAIRILLITSAVACGGIAGDWDAVSVESDEGASTASGILEIDLDGETLLDVTFAGDGPSGSLRATGTTDRGEGTLQLVGTLGPGGEIVDVRGPCVADDRTLACDLEVGDERWSWGFRREGDLLDSPLD